MYEDQTPTEVINMNSEPQESAAVDSTQSRPESTPDSSAAAPNYVSADEYKQALSALQSQYGSQINDVNGKLNNLGKALAQSLGIISQEPEVEAPISRLHRIDQDVLQMKQAVDLQREYIALQHKQFLEQQYDNELAKWTGNDPTKTRAIKDAVYNTFGGQEQLDSLIKSGKATYIDALQQYAGQEVLKGDGPLIRSILEAEKNKEAAARSNNLNGAKQMNSNNGTYVQVYNPFEMTDA